MKTMMQAVAVAVLGMALAGAAWGHEVPGHRAHNPEIDLTLTCTGRTVTVVWDADAHRYGGANAAAHGHPAKLLLYQVLPSKILLLRYGIGGFRAGRFGVPAPNPETLSGSYVFRGEWGAWYIASAGTGVAPEDLKQLVDSPAANRTSVYAEATCDDAPAVSETTGAAARCESVAVVPSIPPAVQVSDGDSRAHWLRITNPLPASVTFAITGHDSTGAKFGTYRRTLAANAMLKARVRDIEAAFDGDGKGWWSLTVTASGPVYVVASMMHTNSARVMLPVERPAVCEAGSER